MLKHQSERAASKRSTIDRFSLFCFIILSNEANYKVLVETGKFLCSKEHIRPVGLEEKMHVFEIKQNCDLFVIQPYKIHFCEVVTL